MGLESNIKFNYNEYLFLFGNFKNYNRMLAMIEIKYF